MRGIERSTRITLGNIDHIYNGLAIDRPRYRIYNEFGFHHKSDSLFRKQKYSILFLFNGISFEDNRKSKSKQIKQRDNQPDCDPGGDFSDVVMISLVICGDMLSVVLSMSSNDRLFPRFPLLIGDE